MPWVPADGSKGGDNVRSEPRQPETRQRGTRRIDQTGRLTRRIQKFSSQKSSQKKTNRNQKPKINLAWKATFYVCFLHMRHQMRPAKTKRMWQQRIRHNLAATSRCQLPASTGDDELRQQSFRAALPMHVQSVASAPGFYKQTFFWRKWKEIWARKKKTDFFFKWRNETREDSFEGFFFKRLLQSGSKSSYFTSL